MTANKDYIFNLRLSRDTVEKLKTKAKENGETASHFARKLLNDGLEVFGDLREDIFPKSSVPLKDQVIHRYEVILMKDEVCCETEKKLKKGTKAIVGETEKGKKHYFHPSVFKKTK